MQNKGSSRAKELIEELNQLANRIDMIDPKVTGDDKKFLRKVATVKIDKLGINWIITKRISVRLYNS